MVRMPSNFSYSQKKPAAHAFSLQLHPSNLPLRVPAAPGNTLLSRQKFALLVRLTPSSSRSGRHRQDLCGGSGLPPHLKAFARQSPLLGAPSE